MPLLLEAWSKEEALDLEPWPASPTALCSPGRGWLDIRPADHGAWCSPRTAVDPATTSATFVPGIALHELIGRGTTAALCRSPSLHRPMMPKVLPGAISAVDPFGRTPIGRCSSWLADEVHVCPYVAPWASLDARTVQTRGRRGYVGQMVAWSPSASPSVSLPWLGTASN